VAAISEMDAFVEAVEDAGLRAIVARLRELIVTAVPDAVITALVLERKAQIGRAGS